MTATLGHDIITTHIIGGKVTLCMCVRAEQVYIYTSMVDLYSMCVCVCVCVTFHRHSQEVGSISSLAVDIQEPLH